jgi:RNA polymerase sigma factor (sigma-70 family)
MVLPTASARTQTPVRRGHTVLTTGDTATIDTALDSGLDTGLDTGVPPDRPGEDRAPDTALVARIAAGDARGLDDLYQRYGRPAYSLARRICADEGLAEDVVQEVFLALWRDPGRFDAARGAVASWLMTLVHHKAVDAVRREATRRRHHPPTDSPDEGVAATGPSASRLALGSVIGEQVRTALGRLPHDQRTALGLAYYGGYTQREVASLTGVPIGTVKSRMFAGVARLRVLLAPVLGTSAFDALGDLS